MNPLRYSLREQAKAIRGGLIAFSAVLTSGAIDAGLSTGEVVTAIVGGLVAFYGVFATSNA